MGCFTNERGKSRFKVRSVISLNGHYAVLWFRLLAWRHILPQGFRVSIVRSPKKSVISRFTGLSRGNFQPGKPERIASGAATKKVE
jgi:hypothetical protein